MKIYIDFDRTLFDCERFIEDFFELLQNYNISKDDFVRYQNQFKDINPYIILDAMSKEKDINKGVYVAIDKLIKESSKYLFDDTIPFLKYLKNKNYQVIILTKGNLDFQKDKIINSHIDSYYDNIIVTSDHKGKLDLDYTNGIFIDDREEELESIKLKNPKRIIAIKRSGDKIKNIETITSLNELINSI